MKSTEDGVSSGKGGGKGLFTVILLLLLVVSAGSATYFYMQLQDLKANPQAGGQQEAEKLLEEVGRLIVLPENEQPTIATVSDVERLRDQPFFAKAKNGDRVWIYTDSRKAILYDPVLKKIVEVAPVNIGQAATPTPPPEDGTFEPVETPEEGQ
jgi:hypothetical protein